MKDITKVGFSIKTSIGFVHTLVLFLGISSFSYAHVNEINLDSIRICKWSGGAKSCVSLSFDDNCKNHIIISQLLDNYGYKGTFFTISSSMLTSNLLDMVSRGHEVGNHTFSHPYMTEVDSSEINYQIRKCKEMLNIKLSIKCLSFAEPGNQFNNRSKRIAQSYQLFNRNYSEYQDVKRIRFDVTSDIIPKLSTYIDSSLKSGTLLIFAAHSIDNDGYAPISKQQFIQSLDLMKAYSDKKELWVTTVKESSCYENFFKEIGLIKRISGDSLIINFTNFNSEKYKDMDQSKISFEIPHSYFKSLRCIRNFIDIEEQMNRYIITVDMKRYTRIVLIIK